MIKCQQCRTKDVELLTRWERFKNWAFYKVNNTFFADDLEDLKSQKYTQGFTDGNIKGVENERRRNEIEQLRYNVEPKQPTEDEVKKALNDLLSPVDLTAIITQDKLKGLIFIGGEKAEAGTLSNLKAEAQFLTESHIWKLLYETPKKLAETAIFVDSQSLDDIKKGKSILYTLSTQKNIIETLKTVK